MSLRQELEEIDTTLKTMIQTVRINWDHQQTIAGIAYMNRVEAESAVDPNGRPLLADLTIARANVLCALANLGKDEQ